MANAPAATHALSVLKLLGPPRRAACRRRRSRATSACPRSTIYHLLDGAARRGLRRAPARAAPLRARRRAPSSSARAYARQEPLRWIAQTVLTRLVDATTHNAPPRRAARPRRAVRDRGARRRAARASSPTSASACPAHLTASGLAMLAALPPHRCARCSRRARVRAAPRRRAGVAHGPAARARRGPRRRLREEDGFVTPGLRVRRRRRARPRGPPGRRGRAHVPGRGGAGAAARGARARAWRARGRAGRAADPRPAARPRPARRSENQARAGRAPGRTATSAEPSGSSFSSRSNEPRRPPRLSIMCTSVASRVHGHHGRAVLERAVVGEDDVQHRGGELRREAGQVLDQRGGSR